MDQCWSTKTHKPCWAGAYQVAVEGGSAQPCYSQWDGAKWMAVAFERKFASQSRVPTALKVVSFWTRESQVERIAATLTTLPPEHVTDWIYEPRPAADRPGVYEVMLPGGEASDVRIRFAYWSANGRWYGMFLDAASAHELYEKAIPTPLRILAFRGATAEGVLRASPPGPYKNFPCKPLVLDTSLISKAEMDKLRVSLRDAARRPGKIMLADFEPFRTPAHYTQLALDTRPRWVAEPWSHTIARCPSLAPFRKVALTGENAAKIFNDADSMPGYQLMQIHHRVSQEALFMFRRAVAA